MAPDLKDYRRKYPRAKNRDAELPCSSMVSNVARGSQKFCRALREPCSSTFHNADCQQINKLLLRQAKDFRTYEMSMLAEIRMRPRFDGCLR